jgi:hypothetical protein
MNEAAHSKGLTKDHLYCVGAAPSLRWQGVKGKEVLVEVATYDAPHVTIRSLKRGMIEFPVADIVELRVGVEFVKRTYYRCMIRRRGAPKFLLYGSNHAADYRELVLHLAEEMQGIGHFDQVRRGLRWWESAVHLVIFGGLALVGCFALYDSWVKWGASWKRDDYLTLGGLGGLALLMLFGTLWIWLRWYRPRRVQDMADLAKVLP